MDFGLNIAIVKFRSAGLSGAVESTVRIVGLFAVVLLNDLSLYF